MVLAVNIKEAGYDRTKPIIKDIQFTVQPGELVGLIGPNGAGKSTTIKALLGILEHVKGDLTVSEYSYIPERPIFYEGLTLWEHILFLLSTLDGNRDDDLKKANELTDLFQLTDVVHQLPESFSKGMQQKMMIILAFLKPSFLHIIDEPFMGLDPKAIKKLQSLIHIEREKGAGILMSTHALDTAERICDRFILISDGRLIVQGTMEDIRNRSGLSEGSLLDCFDVLTEVR